MDPLGLFPDRGAIRMLIKIASLSFLASVALKATRLAQETKVYTVPGLRNTLGASPLSFSSEENPRTLSRWASS